MKLDQLHWTKMFLAILSLLFVACVKSADSHDRSTDIENMSNFDETSISTLLPTATQIEVEESTDNEIQQPVISDNRRVVFASDIHTWGATRLFMIDMDGSNLTQLTFGDSIFDSSPAWSPDGQQIVFTRRLSVAESKDVYLLNVTTLEISQITNTPDDEDVPAWSPTGDFITYMSSGETTDNYDIYVMKLDGMLTKRLTTADSYDSSPAWSPDGSHILFSRDGVLHTINLDCIDEPDTCEENIAEVPNLSGTDFARIWSGIWSPTGDRIAFSASFEDNNQIFVMNADGSEILQLTHGKENHVAPSWSSDGRYIVYSKGGPPPFELYISDLRCLESPDGCDDTGSYRLTNSGNAPNGSLSSSWEPID